MGSFMLGCAAGVVAVLAAVLAALWAAARDTGADLARGAFNGRPPGWRRPTRDLETNPAPAAASAVDRPPTWRA
jgi:hypothetical protein